MESLSKHLPLRVLLDGRNEMCTKIMEKKEILQHAENVHKSFLKLGPLGKGSFLFCTSE